MFIISLFFVRFRQFWYLSKEFIRYLFSLLKPKFIFTQEEEAARFSKVIKEQKLNTKIVVFTKMEKFDSLNEILSQAGMKEVNDFCCFESTNPDDDCLLSLTSSTMTEHKVVAHSYKSIMEGLLLILNSCEQKDDIVSLIYLPLQWIVGQRAMLVDILNSAKRIIVNETSYDLREAFHLIKKYKATNVRFSLNMMHRMFKWPEWNKFDTSSIRKITLNGMKLQPKLMKFLMKLAKNGKLEQNYGTTEIAFPMFGGIMNDIDLNSCGYLKPNTSMKIIDVQTGETLGSEKKGEICFKSPYIMKYYVHNQKATDEAIDSEGWFHSGDVGYYDDSGLGYVLGRVKNTVIQQNGEIVPLWHVERALILNSEVTDAKVIASSQISDETHIIAFVTIIPGSKITEEELSEVISCLSEIKMSITVKILKELPLTYNGKIKLGELKRMAEKLIRIKQ